MEISKLIPRKALNKAFLKIKPNRTEIEKFKTNLIQLIDHTNDKESEEFHKNLISDFLKKTYYDPNYFINTKNRNDLVVHNGNDAKSSVGVIIEAKSTTNKTEMLSQNKLNSKALQELVLYYLRERITLHNLEVKHIVVTNIYEWFIFDANVFEKLFAQNKALVKQFTDFEEGRLAGTKTDFFYKEIAEPFIKELKQTIEFTHFDIREYNEILRNNDSKDDNKLIALFKLLSPEHLLKLPFANDSNSLDKRFYGELLHIIGLTEVKDGGKKLIQRFEEGKRNSGSLLENTINQLDAHDKINQLSKPSQFGDTRDERLFSVAMELTITWINRILFLKLLEAQLIAYHKGDKSYSFLNFDQIRDFDELDELFFQVLARKFDSRNEDVKDKFKKVPYLNSSLFEPTDLEQVTLFISNLKDNKAIPVYSSTVLKDETGKKKSSEINTLEYFFDFLNAYDFSSEGSEEIQEDNKTLINASVLGLIFEKINGYKDGSFFTPGFITMYMCKETIRKAVVQKFNETKAWNITDFDALYDKIDDRKEANDIVNSIKICDPAVGSGHFLVSALNEVIAIKNDLKILQDHQGKRLKEYQVEVVNDELIVTDEDGILFEYNPTNKESQRIQETLFHEKQTIIENCLFGVDINPNSVKICRLRLWVELLKSAYYIDESTSPAGGGLRGRTNEYQELQTLPNIDINIKCGNSLISRFALDADLSSALKKSKWNIDSYKLAVDTYRNATSKEQKREMERLINDIKSDFKTEIGQNSKEQKELNKLSNELFQKYTAPKLFEDTLSPAQKKKQEKERKDLEEKVAKLKNTIEEVKSNKIYENAFEWRFEFPDVLDFEGKFVGFDAVIGNPPYVGLQSMKNDSDVLSKKGYETFDKSGDLYVLFCERANNILKQNGDLSFIIPNKWMSAGYGKNLRHYLISKTNPTKIIDFEKVFVFDEAVVFVCILEFNKQNFNNTLNAVTIKTKYELLNFENEFINNSIEIKKLDDNGWQIVSNEFNTINDKIEKSGTPLKDWKGIGFYAGIKTACNEAFILDDNTVNKIISEEPKSEEIIKKVLRGRNIKRYTYEFDNIYLINTYNGENNPIKGEPRINRVDVVNDFPVVYDFMLQYKDQLIKREDKGEHWTNLRNCAFEKEFSNDKIVWIEISDKANFTIDYSKMYLTNSAYFLTGHSLKYLLAVLNSKVCDFYFFQKTALIAGGRKRYTKQYVEQNPIPIISEEKQQPFIELVDKILSIKKENPETDTTALENEIDQLVYQLYELTEEEIKVVEESVK